MSMVKDWKNAPDKDFINFNFDGKDLVDFGLVAAYGDRLARNLQPDFTDNVSEVPGKIGQEYWGTSIHGSVLNFLCSTDDMTARQRENFKRNFCAGKVAQFYTSESPYRYCYARIAEPPQDSFIPFDSSEKIGSETIATVTYKGDVTVMFALANPLWYSKYAYLSTNVGDDNYYKSRWALESGIPWQSTLNSGVTYLLGNGKMYFGNQFVNNTDVNFNLTTAYTNIYNAGSFDSYPKIKFDITPQFNNNNYISFPYNDFPKDAIHPKWNTIYMSDPRSTLAPKALRFTLPRIMYEYNNACEIADSYTGTYDDNLKQTIMNDFRDLLGHPIIRTQAIGWMRATSTTNSNTFKANLKKVFSNNGVVNVYSFIFNAEEGTSFVEGKLGICDFTINMNIVQTTFSESAADMLRSGFITIPAGDGVGDNGKISGVCRIYSDTTLFNFKIDFLNTYV